MSLLINGLNMPKNCLLCPCCVGEGIGMGRQHYCQGIDDESCVSETYRPKNCPLIEVPTPHGRLIDADRLLESIKTNFYEHFGNYDSGQELLFDLICNSIEDSLTIIEAEE